MASTYSKLCSVRKRASAGLSPQDGESATMYLESPEILKTDFTFNTTGVTFFPFLFSQIQKDLAALSLVLYLVNE